MTGFLLAKDFNPRSPHGERLEREGRKSQRWQFQSTLPARGATTERPEPRLCSLISIHAPRTGSDVTSFILLMLRWMISIHAPRTGSDVLSVLAFGVLVISIHAPRTGSDGTAAHGGGGFRRISIHAPRTGSDFEG